MYFVEPGNIALHTRLTHERNPKSKPDISLQVQGIQKLQVHMKFIEQSHGR